MIKIVKQKEYLVIVILTIVKLTLHFIMNINAGLDGDEVLHIDSGNHPAWGYISIQPLIGLFAWIQNLFNSNSVYVHHLFAHISAVLIMIFSGLTVIKLGGKWKAVMITLTCILVAPGFNLSQHIFTPLVFEQLFWILSFYVLIGYCKDNNPKQLIYLAVLLAVGFMTKISVLILIAGICISVLIFRRDLFAKRVSWFAVALFIIIISPNIIWQYMHGFPSVQHMSTLHNKVLVQLDIADNIKLLLLTTNPLTVIVWFTAILLAPFIKSTKKVRLAVTSISVSFLILMMFRGQFHYYFPTLLIAISVGSVIVENYIRKRIYPVFIYVAILSVSAIFMMPKILPLLPLDSYISHLNLNSNSEDQDKQVFFTQQSIADNKTDSNDKRIPINFEGYYILNDWINLTDEINSIYSELPAKKREKCYIWTRCYTHAGGINLVGKRYNLPEAFSQHGNYHEWIPEFDKGATIIVVANAESPADSLRIGRFFNQSFEKLNWQSAIFCPHARTRSNAYYMLYLGEGLKYNSDTLKRRYEDFVFE